MQGKILSGDNFDFDLMDYLSFKSEEVNEILNKPRFQLNTDEVSSRVINHWEDKMLISPYRQNDTGHRKYSLIEFVWVNIIIQLRAFGVGLDEISLANSLLFKRQGSGRVPSEILEMYIVMALLRKDWVYLLFYQGGAFDLATRNDVNFTERLHALEPHFRVCLNELIRQIFGKDSLSPLPKSSNELSNSEKKLLLLMRTGDYSEITVKMSNGTIKRLELTESKSESKLYKLLKEKTYDTITLERREGEVVHVKRKIKVKMNHD